MKRGRRGDGRGWEVLGLYTSDSCRRDFKSTGLAFWIGEGGLGVGGGGIYSVWFSTRVGSFGSVFFVWQGLQGWPSREAAFIWRSVCVWFCSVLCVFWRVSVAG
ncbi:hypothetical protein FN846DRAFT_76615 [Sphaerosporella brunnea]|uniref:Uncharacterized protein n=1 Tax=Sphaerosporella brunnea TaxID=1250544 RepID=A0A5J5F9N8_9PEZI|nr:hypothetical protein FN846DRAFT_76615 [Sphaerosporella brunnea]